MTHFFYLIILKVSVKCSSFTAFNHNAYGINMFMTRSLLFYFIRLYSALLEIYPFILHFVSHSVEICSDFLDFLRFFHSIVENTREHEW